MPRHIYIIDLHYLYDNVNELKLEKPFTNYELITKNTKIPQSLQHTNSNFLLLQEALHMKIEERRSIVALKLLRIQCFFCNSYT